MKKILAAMLALLLLCGCSAKEAKAQQTIFCMDTVMDLQIWGRDCEEAMAACSRELLRLQDTWSATDEDSLLCRLNRKEEPPLRQEEWALLEAVEGLKMRTGGAFDPNLGALCEVWGFYGENGHVPTDSAILRALKASRWDLGAAIKGYAGAKLVEILEQYDVSRAVLNLGGNIQTYGKKRNGEPWNIAIQNPQGGDYVGTVVVEDTCAVVTSGDYQRYFEENGVRYHHILDPGTGYPADSGLSSVTVICREGLTADALSTALFVMGLERATEFWRASDDFEAVFILKTGEIYATEGAKLSGCEFEVIAREK